MLSTKQALIQRLTQERATLFHTIAFLPDDVLVQRPAVGEWSVKDVLGHVTAWEEEILVGIEDFLRGQRPWVVDIADTDAWNANKAREKWDMPLHQVKDEMIATRKRLLDLVASLPDEALQRPGPPPSQQPFIPQMLNVIADHDREHWSDLMRIKEAWIARQRAAA